MTLKSQRKKTKTRYMEQQLHNYLKDVVNINQEQRKDVMAFVRDVRRLAVGEAMERKAKYDNRNAQRRISEKS